MNVFRKALNHHFLVYFSYEMYEISSIYRKITKVGGIIRDFPASIQGPMFRDSWPICHSVEHEEMWIYHVR